MMRVETSSSGGGQPNNSSKKYYFHLQCFGCEICGHRFCVGDPFFFDNEKIICEDEKSLHGDELYLQRISPKIFRMNDGKSE
jgi:hypothetical protein